MTEIILFWFILSLVVGFIGSSKSIGFFFSFLLSLLLSPLIGLIIVALSDSKATKHLKKEVEALKASSPDAAYQTPKTDAQIFREDAEKRKSIAALATPEAIKLRREAALKQLGYSLIILLVIGFVVYEFAIK